VDTPAFRGVGIYITGGKSCQKTTMLCVLGKELLLKGKDVKFVTAKDLVSLMVKVIGYSNKETEVLERRYDVYSNCEYLLIDDMFNLGTSSYWKSNEDIIKAEWNYYDIGRENFNRRQCRLVILYYM
jgi:DNA replication protein DnaC